MSPPPMVQHDIQLQYTVESQCLRAGRPKCFIINRAFGFLRLGTFFACFFTRSFLIRSFFIKEALEKAIP